ncbi:MAG: hypothetical protein JOZ72_11710 [Alphaproteobacteria bacterium]|nr:hypothetical protein [Alphaproteobacteria bacterium]
MTDDLDILLSEPLDDVADDGFSARILAGIERKAWWRERVTMLAAAVAAAAVLPFVPAAELGAVAFAAGALTLTFAFEQRLRDA